MTLYDQHGHVISRTQKRASTFEASMRMRRLKAWQTTDQAINSILQGGVAELRRRSRQMVRDNPYADNAVDIFCSNLIGNGIKPTSLVEDDSFKQEIHELWDEWISEADADWRTDFNGLQTLVARGIFEAGEVFIRFRPRRLSDNLSVPLQLQILESEQLPLDNTPATSTNNEVRLGIEFDRIGRRVAYHFLREHPGDSTQRQTGQRVRVPAEDVIHIYRPLRPGQIRGQPRMNASIVKMFLLDQYDDAELDRKKVAALYAAFITDNSDAPMPAEEETNDDGAVMAPMEPGTTVKLDPGEDVRFSEPADVGGNYESFQYRTILALAAGLGIPYAELSMDLRHTSYSSIRTGVLAFRRRLEQVQRNVIIHQLCRPVWNRFIQQALLAGELSGDFRTLRRRVKWMPPRWPWVDPLKDRQAERVAVRSGFKSRSDVVVEEGFDPEAMDQRVAEDNKRADDLDLVYDSDARRVSNAGVGQDGRTLLPEEQEEENNNGQ